VLVPTSWLPRYQVLPEGLRSHARFAEARLRALRWAYLGINLWFQLELTRAQIPLQRLGKVIEHLVAMLACVHHAAALRDPSLQKVAALQCEQLAAKVRGLPLLTGLRQMERLGQCSLLQGVVPQAFAHPFEARQKKPR
jgi:hypothetical protein